MQTEALLISGQIQGGNDALEREVVFPKRKLMTRKHTLVIVHARTNAKHKLVNICTLASMERMAGNYNSASGPL